MRRKDQRIEREREGERQGRGEEEKEKEGGVIQIRYLEQTKKGK